MDITIRGNKVEAGICKLLHIDQDQFIELWYETGCRFAEEFFRSLSLTGKGLDKAVTLYITSNLFWYRWALNLVRGCEMFLESEMKTKDELVAYLMKMPRPNRSLHKKIIEMSALNRKPSIMVGT